MKTYLTVSEALADLKVRGYEIDFNQSFAGIPTTQPDVSLAPDKFRITEVYRFEGETSPDDEAIVYAIESTDGIKGTLVNGYGISADTIGQARVKELLIDHTSIKGH